MAGINETISTPGEVLVEEFLEPLGITLLQLAQAIGKPESDISDIIHNKSVITAEMAWLLSQALGTTPGFWLNLQDTYLLKELDTSKYHVEHLVEL